MVIEVLSPSTARIDKVNKHRMYQNAGVLEYWIVDPDDKFLMGNILRNGVYVGRFYYDDDNAVPIEVLEGCVIDLAEVFAGI